MSSDPLEPVAREFARFAEEECRNCSPLYERLSLAIARDEQILALTSHARKGERIPNLFLASVHFLLLKGIEHPVSVFYRRISSASHSTEDPYPKFRAFCLRYSDDIRSLISTCMVQTNEVGHCAFLLPAFVFVSRKVHGRPLFLIEIGASAGLISTRPRRGGDSELRLVALENEVRSETLLANCENHGEWLEWLAADTD